jgi:putative membrane protein
MMWGYNWGWGAWLGTGIVMILFWGLVIAGIIALVRYVGGTGKTGRSIHSPARPEDELAERFARGEIDEDE